MAKVKTIFVCQNCGARSPRWVGKCPGCQSWNSFVEEEVTAVHRSAGRREAEKPRRLQEIASRHIQRWITGLVEFDRVMGGGVVPGGVTLIGGDPGIGKSTLSLQIAEALARQGQRVLYISGEESVEQTKMRAERLMPEESSLEALFLVNQVDLESIKQNIKEIQPDVLIVDSIQVLYHPEVSSSPGSVSQVRECASILTHLAKSKRIALFIIGHVTKEGTLAGPRVLEHIVDTVLYFEGERYTSYRILRSIKNRFGATQELGVFEMTAGGLREVTNPSEIFLAERPAGAAGSVVVPVIEGTRSFLVEVQGLVSRSSFGILRQKAQGFDPNRLALLVAVLEKRLNLNLYDKDIFLNVAGGVRVMDPAADLAVTLAIISALTDQPIPEDLVVVGEVGLSSEVRSVSQLGRRLPEAAKLGFRRCLIPAKNLQAHVDYDRNQITTLPVNTLREAVEAAGLIPEEVRRTSP